MLSYVRWAAAAFVLVSACSLSEGTDPSTLTDASTGDGGVCDPSTCPGKDNECGRRGCTDNSCTMTYVAAGPAPTTQIAGDCRTDSCDGKGTFAAKIDDTDVPDDKNPCTKDLCTNGTPSNTPGPAGATCGTGLLCNSTGQCVGCLKAADCPGIDSECGTRICAAGGICGMNFAASGKAISSQVAGDCHVLQCDGKGTVISAVDNGDVPVDGNQCTSDQCSFGTPLNPPTASGTACNVSGKTLCNGSGVCVQCLVATTCPGDPDTFCSLRTCVSNACGFNYTANGTVTPTQTTGDCHQNQCNGGGGVTNAIDNADIKNDNNDCTTDTCNAGTPANTATAPRTVCAGGGGKVLCDGSGVCVQCLVPADCGVDTFCSAHTCNSGVCGVNNKAPGTATPSQVTGDCHQNQCDGNGGVTNAIDNTDTTSDNNDCTTDTCSNGTLTYTPTAPRTVCAGGGGKVLCDGSGVCVECLVPADCGSDTICATRTCNAGACGVNNTSAGTWCAGTDAGVDAGESVCDGLGACLP